MSSSALSRPRRSAPSRPPVRAAKPVLRLVHPEVGPRATVPTLVAALLIIAILIFTPLFINTQMAGTSYQMHTLEIQLAQIREENQALQDEVARLGSPSALDEAARKNGMIPAGKTGFITLSTGKIEKGEVANGTGGQSQGQ